ncbi:unnamed protein product [Arctogadus glacialis]
MNIPLYGIEDGLYLSILCCGSWYFLPEGKSWYSVFKTGEWPPQCCQPASRLSAGTQCGPSVPQEPQQCDPFRRGAITDALLWLTQNVLLSSALSLSLSLYNSQILPTAPLNLPVLI